MPGESDRSRRPRQAPWYALAAVDVLLIGLSLVVFALFDHVKPRKGIPAADVTYAPAPTQSQIQAEAATDVPAETADAAQASATPEPAPVGDFSARFADKFTGGEVIATDTSYTSANISVTLTRYDTIYEGSPVVYYIEDIYIRQIDSFRTVFAKDTYGKAIREDVVNMSQRTNAIAAINGDYYGVGTPGLCIRNGVLYGSNPESGDEALVLFRDGTMKVYHDQSSIDVDEIMAQGAWQSFSFGPRLFDENGGIQVEVKKGLYTDPRCVVGMVEPGHYVFMVVDGRQDGYSAGMTYAQCAEVMQSLGCTLAYNLDGGATAQMTFMGQLANQPTGGGRSTSDMLIIVD